MFNDDDPIPFKRMQEFSTVDGFLEVAEELKDMIKCVANEPSAGLFYVQKHIQNATPHLINLKNNVVEKSHETLLHTEDLEDSITVVRSMKECGFPIADEMIREIKTSISIMCRKQPKKGLLSSSGSGYIGRTSSWSPSTSGNNTLYSLQDSKNTGGYLSGVFKSAKQKVNFKWLQGEYVESNEPKSEKLSFVVNPTFPDADDHYSPVRKVEGEDFLLSEIGNKLQEESQPGESFSPRASLS